MTAINTTFFEDLKSFTNKHKVLCATTLGLAVVAYSLGNLAGRAIAWIRECMGTTKKADHVGRQSLMNSHLSSDSKITSISNANLSSPKVEEFIEALREEEGVEISGNESDTWHEVVFDNNPYEKGKVHCPWKLHISPGSDTLALLDAIKPVLLKNRPYCKIVQNHEKLEDLENSLDINNKHVFKGKCITIYPKSEQEALSLATELNEAIIASGLINQEGSRYPCTDRPLGMSGYLWSRNDLAGGPIDEASLKDSDHAHAMPGNYNTTVILPDAAYDFETNESGRKAYDKWYNREFPNFQRIVHKDIFVETFGAIQWKGRPESDNGWFESV